MKPFEIQYKEYVFNKYTRKLRFEPKWKHLRMYKSISAANDAITQFRKGGYWDYPGDDLEKDYPHITPSITITRWRIVGWFTGN